MAGVGVVDASSPRPATAEGTAAEDRLKKTDPSGRKLPLCAPRLKPSGDDEVMRTRARWPPPQRLCRSRPGGDVPEGGPAGSAQGVHVSYHVPFPGPPTNNRRPPCGHSTRKHTTGRASTPLTAQERAARPPHRTRSPGRTGTSQLVLVIREPDERRPNQAVGGQHHPRHQSCAAKQHSILSTGGGG